MYVFDTTPLIDMFRHYYPSRFPTLWTNFNALILNGLIVSTRENYREIQRRSDTLSQWSQSNGSIFHFPNQDETEFINQIFRVKHFRENINKQMLYKGGLNADTFVIAKARIEERIVVTGELFKPNAAKIPNICQHFGIRCINLEQFMEEENWSF